MTAGILSREVKTCRYSNTSVINADIRWSFSKRREPLENISAIIATAPVCKNCSQALPSGAVNQRAKPARPVRAVRAQVIYARVAHALPVCETPNRQFVECYVGVLNFFSFRYLSGYFYRLNTDNRAGLLVTRCLGCLRAFPTGINICEEFFEPVERSG